MFFHSDYNELSINLLLETEGLSHSLHQPIILKADRDQLSMNWMTPKHSSHASVCPFQLHGISQFDPLVFFSFSLYQMLFLVFRITSVQVWNELSLSWYSEQKYNKKSKELAFKFSILHARWHGVTKSHCVFLILCLVTGLVYPCTEIANPKAWSIR